jgi:hypothetical protein
MSRTGLRRPYRSDGGQGHYLPVWDIFPFNIGFLNGHECAPVKSSWGCFFAMIRHTLHYDLRYDRPEVSETSYFILSIIVVVNIDGASDDSQLLTP